MASKVKKPRAEVYWAAEADLDKLGQNIATRFDRYRDDLGRKLRGTRIRQATLRWYGIDPDDGAAVSSDITLGGEEGELTLAQVNHFRSLIRSMKALATSSRPAFDATARDDSSDSLLQCELAEQLWDYELDQGLESSIDEAETRMLVQSEGALGVFWDATKGEIVGAEPVYELDANGEPVLEQPRDPSGQPLPLPPEPVKTGERAIKAGMVVYESFGPGDVARDLEFPGLRTLPWIIVRRRMHRYDLAALYPEYELAQEILGARGPADGSEFRGDDGSIATTDTSDMVWVLELYHERTPAIPEGRYVRVVGSKVLELGPLQYEQIPVIVRAPDREFDRAAGYTDTWDLLGLAKAVDACVSDFIAMMDRYGEMPALIPEGADIDAKNLTQAGAVRFKWQQGMPLPAWMQPPEIPGSFFQMLEWMTNTMQLLIGVNSVVRGDPHESLKSGAALALVQAMAVQHASAFQATAADLRVSAATRVIETYRQFAATPRLIDIAGEGSRGSVRSFVGSDLTNVRRIKADLTNPMMRTVAGKAEIVEKLIKDFPNEPPITRAQYIGFLDTGRYDPVFRAGRSEEIGIKAENEALARGEPVPVTITDNPIAHIPEHKALLDGKKRLDLTPQAIKAITDHIISHEIEWQRLTNEHPVLLAALGYPPAPAPMPMAPPGGAPADDGGAPAPGADGGGGAPIGPPNPGAMNPSPIPGTGPAAAQMPRPPMNPATGERVQLPDAAVG